MGEDKEEKKASQGVRMAKGGSTEEMATFSDTKRVCFRLKERLRQSTMTLNFTFCAISRVCTLICKANPPLFPFFLLCNNCAFPSSHGFAGC